VFFCHFWWGKKDIRFEVYRETGACGHKTRGSNKGICYWLIKEDDFYFAINGNPPPSTFVRKFGW